MFANRPGVKVYTTHRRDLFLPDLVEVLAVQVQDAALQPYLFQQAERALPDLTYYDADIPISIRAQAELGIFPLVYCVIAADEQNVIQSIRAFDTPWDLDTLQPPIRILSLEPDVNPAHAAPNFIQIRYEKRTGRIQLQPERPFLINLASILNSYDPDLLLTNWGDTWLIEHLLKLARKWKVDVAHQPRARPGCAAQGRADLFFVRAGDSPRQSGAFVRPAAHRPGQCHAVG